jgi:hypothetical protein
MRRDSKIITVDAIDCVLEMREIPLPSFAELGQIMNRVDGFLFVYFTTDRSSFESIQPLYQRQKQLWRYQSARHTFEECPMVLVGHKPEGSIHLRGRLQLRKEDSLQVSYRSHSSRQVVGMIQVGTLFRKPVRFWCANYVPTIIIYRYSLPGPLTGANLPLPHRFQRVPRILRTGGALYRCETNIAHIAQI